MAQMLLVRMGYGYYGPNKKSYTWYLPKRTCSSEADIQRVWQVRVERLMNQLFISGNGIYFLTLPLDLVLKDLGTKALSGRTHVCKLCNLSHAYYLHS